MTEAAAPQAPDLAAAALALHEAGLSVIPAAIDGTKAPMGRWQRYQSERMPVEQLNGWLRSGHPGWGVVTGAISGNLELLEFEGRAVDLVPQFVALAQAAGLGGTVQGLMTGYMETTPSGGIHLLYRVDGAPVPGNTKLAKRPARDDELVEHELKTRETKPDAVFARTLIETRGERGFVVTAPSHGTTHETGRPWVLVAGGPSTIPTITAEEHAALHQLAATFDQMPHADPSAVRFAQPTNGARPEGGVSPGDDYEARTDWAEILAPHGWTCVAGHGNTRYWRRPGKRLGVSATTGQAADRDRLYVFTTSTVFESEIPYTKFGAYALLEHGGDHSAAARALHSTGYGTPAPEPARPVQFVQPAGETPNEHQADEQPDPTAAAQVTEPTTYSLTDDGNALRLVDEHSDQIRYCPQRHMWLAWDGHRWRWDHAESVREHAKVIARTLPTADKDQTRHRQRSLSALGIANMVNLARTDRRVVAEIDQLDQQPYELNTPNGAVDLRTGELRPPDPAALHTRSTAIAPDPTHHPALWEKFLATTFAGDPALTLYIQRLLGVSLVGTVLEQLLPFGFGEGANGKTTLLNTVMRIVGLGDSGYALSAPAELLLATHNAGHPTEIARLAGARLVVTSELDDGQKFAEAKVKSLTGSEPIAARFMRGDFFTFRPSHSLWLLGNHQPQVRVGGPAFWRRIRLLPFLHVVPPEERDPGLEDRMVEEEGPAILAWLIRGAVDYFAEGLAEPESVRAATSEYEGQQDTISRFVEEMCEVGSPALQHMAVAVPKFRTAYETWCRQEGEEPSSARALTMALRSRFDVVSERSMSTRFYRGIRLLEASSDGEEASSQASWGSGEDGPSW